MAILSDMRERIDTLDSRVGMDVEGCSLLEVVRRLGTDAVVEMVESVSAIRHDAERIIAVRAAVLAERSTRDLGQSGAAAVRGHATPVSLVQSISGGTRADAVRAIRIGGALLEGSSSVEEDSMVEAVVPWHEPLGRAMLSGELTPSQHDAILRGLGEPPAGSEPVDADAAREVWALAAQQLIVEAAGIEVEELAGEPVVLGSRSAVRWAWDPPPPEARAGWRAA